MAKIKNHWSGPPKNGTKSNEIFRALLKGVRSDALRSKYGEALVKAAVETLRNMCGYDIRSFKVRGIDLYEARSTQRGPRHPKMLMIVGRHKWGGGYVSFIDPADYEDVI